MIFVLIRGYVSLSPYSTSLFSWGSGTVGEWCSLPFCYSLSTAWGSILWAHAAMFAMVPHYLDIVAMALTAVAPRCRRCCSLSWLETTATTAFAKLLEKKTHFHTFVSSYYYND